MLPDGRRTVCMVYGTIPGLDLYCTDLAQHLITAGSDLQDDLDRDLSNACTGMNAIYVRYQ